MKKLLLVIFLLLPGILAAQNEFSMQIVIRDQISQLDKNFFGYKNNATDLLDDNQEIGEFELPTLAFPPEINGAFVIQKQVLNNENMPILEDIFSYKDYKPYFKNNHDSIVYTYKVVNAATDFNMLFNGNIPADIKSAKVYSLDYPFEEYDLLKSKLIKIKYINALLSYNFKIVIKNYEDDLSVEQNDDLKIYPNPTENYINFDKDISSEINIIDFTGKVFNKSLKNNRLNLDEFPAGIYIISGKDINMKYFRKIVVKN